MKKRGKRGKERGRRRFQYRFSNYRGWHRGNVSKLPVRRTQFLPSYLPSSLEISQVSHRGNCRDPLSTPILISRIPSSAKRGARRFFRAIEGDVCIIRREQTRALKRAHWLLRWSQRLDMCIHADCEELAETCANTRSLPRRHETEAYSRARAVCSIRKIRTVPCVSWPADISSVRNI